MVVCPLLFLDEADAILKKELGATIIGMATSH